jgi:hypothetical protein
MQGCTMYQKWGKGGEAIQTTLSERGKGNNMKTSTLFFKINVYNAEGKHTQSVM